jgi:dimethylhistidine N-methyltransferase
MMRTNPGQRNWYPSPMSIPVYLHDYHPAPANLREEVIAGLSKTNKELPCKLFYDERGSELFERICELEEYYPTRTEARIMDDHGGEMAAAVGEDCLLIEYGSGSSEKTRILLDRLCNPVAYVPIDISREHLMESSRGIAREYPRLEVLPICADYEQQIDIPEPVRRAKTRLVYFPGSSIGNFHPPSARRHLTRMAQQAGPGGRLLIGVDLKKDPDVLNSAYNDRDGVTAEFNRNILLRINREIGTQFDPNRFAHHAYYNEAAGRVEMHLVSLEHQTVRLDGVEHVFEEGESIWTESSYKYDLDEFAQLASGAGFVRESVWTDDDEWFSVQLYSVQPGD